MVLESLNPINMEKHPRDMIYIGFIYSTIGLFLGLAVFGKYASISGIFLTSMPLIVIMYNAIKYEEEKDKLFSGEARLLEEHSHIISLFIFLFIGLVISYSFWFTVLPADTVSKAFQSHIETIESITQRDIQLDITGQTTRGVRFNEILANNLKKQFRCYSRPLKNSPKGSLKRKRNWRPEKKLNPNWA